MAKRFPRDTLVQFNYLPTIHAPLALRRNDAAKAIQALQAASPYETGTPTFGAFSPALYPIYVRGEAYLAAHMGGGGAAVEFQKILDNPGVVANEPIGALARCGLARAYAMTGNTAEAQAKYQDFFKLWKEADPNIPSLRQARSDFAKLR